MKETIQTTKNSRNTGLDLLRIMAMLMILTLHYLGKGGALQVEGKTSYIVWFLEISCMVAVNVYILISGYFLVDSKFSWKKVFKLCKETWFYSILFFIIELVLGNGATIKEILCAIFPILLKVYWFVTIYILLYIMSPYLNILIHHLNKKQHLSLCLILVVIFSVIHLVLPPMGILNPMGGYGIIWFIILYLIAGYVKKHVKIKKSCKMLITYFGITIFVMAMKFILEYILKEHTTLVSYVERIFQYYSIFILINSLCLFLYFKDISIKNIRITKIITVISPLTFGVYLIHENIFVAKYLYSNIFCSLDYANAGIFQFLINYIIFIVAVFSICCIIDYTRSKLFNKLSMTKLSKTIEEKEKVIFNKINENINKKILE